jgi:hypothetical protein
MADETLLTAARRVVRFHRIDESHGGLQSIDTLKAIETLDKQVREEETRVKMAEDYPTARHL